uniref:Thioredoxin domain-containing protein n=1 Tax=Anolis carolinensis TaxID=28377 RepID=A0A803SVM5_ANOCA
GAFFYPLHQAATFDLDLLDLVDVYQGWCGPCKAVMSLFRKLKNEYGEDNLLHFAVAEVENIVPLLPFKDKCEPKFIFCLNGVMVDLVKGANGPLLNRKVIAFIEQERKIIAGEILRPEVTKPLLYFGSTSVYVACVDEPSHLLFIYLYSTFFTLKGTRDGLQCTYTWQTFNAIRHTIYRQTQRQFNIFQLLAS